MQKSPSDKERTVVCESTHTLPRKEVKGLVAVGGDRLLVFLQNKTDAFQLY